MPLPKSPIQRKLRYIDMLASPEGINLSMLRWSSMLPQIELSIGFNVLFRYLLDLHLNLNYHIEMPEFDISKFEFTPPEIPELEPIYRPPETPEPYKEPTKAFEPVIEEVAKAKYDLSKYGETIYDPEQVTGGNLERFIWTMRYKTTDKDFPYYKSTSKALIGYLAPNKDIIKGKGVKQEYVDGIVDLIALVEGKIANAGYWDFAIFDVSKFMETESEISTFKLREPDGIGKDWKTEVEYETERPFECHWDFARFDYARFDVAKIEIRPELPNFLDAIIKDFQARSGMVKVEEKGVKYDVLYQRAFMLPRAERYHWRGGGHQLRTQSIINEVKALLDRRGIFGNQRLGYLSFAQQLAYLNYQPHKYWKRWRNLLTPEDLVYKFKKLGMNETILGEIRGIVGK